MRKTEINILNWGSSLGVSRIDENLSAANNKIKINITRFSLFIKYKSTNIIIDSSSNIKN